MIGYSEFTEHAPPASSKEERDAWFDEHGFDVHALAQVGREVAEYRLAGLVEGDQLSEQELLLTMMSIFLFGFELAVRVERDEAVDTTAASNGDGPA